MLRLTTDPGCVGKGAIDLLQSEYHPQSGSVWSWIQVIILELENLWLKRLRGLCNAGLRLKGEEQGPLCKV